MLKEADSCDVCKSTSHVWIFYTIIFWCLSVCLCHSCLPLPSLTTSLPSPTHLHGYAKAIYIKKTYADIYWTHKAWQLIRDKMCRMASSSSSDGWGETSWNLNQENKRWSFAIWMVDSHPMIRSLCLNSVGNSCRARFHGGGGGCPLTTFCRNEITTYKLFGISVCCSMVSFTPGKQNQTQKAQLPKSCRGWINPQRDRHTNRETDRDFHKNFKVLLLSQLSKYWAPGSVLTENQWMNLVCFW